MRKSIDEKVERFDNICMDRPKWSTRPKFVNFSSNQQSVKTWEFGFGLRLAKSLLKVCEGTVFHFLTSKYQAIVLSDTTWKI